VTAGNTSANRPALMARGRAETALLIIDMQKGFLLGDYPVFELKRLLTVVAGLRGRAWAAGVPVVYTQFDGEASHPAALGTSGWEIHECLAPGERDIIVRKKSTDSFHRSRLHKTLCDLGVGRLYVVGCITELCVDTTCRRAISMGYEVTLVADGHTTIDAEIEGLDPATRIRFVNRVISKVGTRSGLIEVTPSADVGSAFVADSVQIRSPDGLPDARCGSAAVPDCDSISPSDPIPRVAR
jgi:nicotinamidase-related amidase